MKSIEEIASSLRSQGIDVEPVQYCAGYDLNELEEHLKEVYKSAGVPSVLFFQENSYNTPGNVSKSYIVLAERLKQLTKLEEN